jgi:hypothetical protein
MTKNESLN